MKRMYLIELEIGNRAYGATYNVVATSDEAAIRKAKQRARKDVVDRLNWRVTLLVEKPEQLVA